MCLLEIGKTHLKSGTAHFSDKGASSAHAHFLLMF